MNSEDTQRNKESALPFPAGRSGPWPRRTGAPKASATRRDQNPWSALGPHRSGNPRFSAGMSGHERSAVPADRRGHTSLYDAVGKVRHPSALDHPRALQVDRSGAEVVEQSDAAPEQDGHQV